jgi:hypothetical protein
MVKLVSQFTYSLDIFSKVMSKSWSIVFFSFFVDEK